MSRRKQIAVDPGDLFGLIQAAEQGLKHESVPLQVAGMTLEEQSHLADVIEDLRDELLA